jgi:hypothetical protein
MWRRSALELGGVTGVFAERGNKRDCGDLYARLIKDIVWLTI